MLRMNVCVMQVCVYVTSLIVYVVHVCMVLLVNVHVRGQ